MKHLLSGNEAAARGAYEAGVKVCSAYPGTPSTEIFENLPQYKDSLYCEWAPNEKVATEVAIGAALGGVRSLTAMKHVGVNVAADPIFTAAYNGVDRDSSLSLPTIPPCIPLRTSRTTGIMPGLPVCLWWSLRTLRSVSTS